MKNSQMHMKEMVAKLAANVTSEREVIVKTNITMDIDAVIRSLDSGRKSYAEYTLEQCLKCGSYDKLPVMQRPELCWSMNNQEFLRWVVEGDSYFEEYFNAKLCYTQSTDR